MSAIRPLPARPSLEFDRKQARRLLRDIRALDPDALRRARAHHPTLGRALAPTVTPAVTLADAQLIIAREYGFGSWPRLVHYHAGVALLRGRRVRVQQASFFESSVRGILDELRAGRRGAARAFGAYVPRCYGLTVDEIFALDVTEDEARLAIARMYGAPSWEVLVDASHETLGLPPRGSGTHTSSAARTNPSEQLCGHMNFSTDDVLMWLDNGADPDWVAPNGLTVLEHAVLRYLNRDAIDLLASRAKPPRPSLWMAAGLGDVATVRRHVGRHGQLSLMARKDRAPFDGVGPVNLPALPEADDAEILFEAFHIAVQNQRTAVIECMASRGLDVNAIVWDVPALVVAVGNGWVEVVDCLLRLGADPELRGWRPECSAREMAIQMVNDAPATEPARRIAALLGVDPNAD
jgi:hypothetical protein